MPDHMNQTVRRGRLRSAYIKWLPAALAAATVANIVLTVYLPPSARPIYLHDDASLIELVHTEQPSVNRRYGFYLELDDATDPGTLFVPSDSILAEELVDGFAELDMVVSEYEPALPKGIDAPAPVGVLETDGGDYGYSLIEGGDDVWWLAVTGDSIVVIPDTVAPVPEASP